MSESRESELLLDELLIIKTLELIIYNIRA